MRVIIAGSRSFDDYATLKKFCDEVIGTYRTRERVPYQDIEIVSGGCVGADQLGERYARASGWKCKVFPAQWDEYGKAAGPIRNGQMAEYACKSPDGFGVLIAFPGINSKGTKNMIVQASNADLDIYTKEID